MKPTRISDVPDWLLSHGRTTANTTEISLLLGIPESQVRKRLRPALETGRLFSPARSLWIPIPPEFRTWGSIPVLNYLDPLMNHLKRSYYVGWLSAAEIFGAAHQRPQVTQVAVDRQLATLRAGRTEIHFHHRADVSQLPRTKHKVPTGEVWISSPELTAVDLADTPRRGGGISNVASTLKELAAEVKLDGRLIAEIAEKFPIGTSRRLGYLLEFVDAQVNLKPLMKFVHENPASRNSMLSPGGKRKGTVNHKWNVILNTEVEPDL
jgi:predicted transcriptional regulator of viral defense system